MKIQTIALLSALMMSGTLLAKDRIKPPPAERNSYYTRDKVGTFQGAGFKVVIRAYYRNRRGNIGGPNGSRSIRIHSYGGKIYVSALPGYKIAPKSYVIFNTRMMRLRNSAKDRRARRARFFTSAKPVRTHSVDLTSRSFRMPVDLQLNLRDKNGKIHRRQVTLTIASGNSRGELKLTEVKRKGR